MTDHAIVIGLDKYEHPGWTLQSAVADAVQFAKWVTEPGKGRATPATLKLLLAPRDGVEPELPYERATQATITAALRPYVKGISVDGVERLWFFYAGHAVSASSSAPDDPPLLVPPEVLSLEDYLFEQPIVLSKYLGALQVRKPNTQIFFIDACRGLVESLGPFQSTNALTWDLSKLGQGLGAAVQSQQAVLYAATLGEKANEVGGAGLFSRALLEGLRGRGPSLKPDPQTSDFALEFNALTTFTQRRVRSLVEDAITKDSSKTIRVQDPTPSLHRNAGDLVLDRFEELPPARLRVFVGPPEALAAGKAGIKTVLAHSGKFGLVEERAPLTVPVIWELAPGARTFQVASPGYRSATRTVELVDEFAVRVQLEEAEVMLGDVETTAFPPEALMSLDGLESLPDTSQGQGRIEIRTYDRRARFTLSSAEDELIAAGYGDLERNLTVGSYRAAVIFPGLAPVDNAFFIADGETELWEVTPTAAVSSRLCATLRATDMGFSDGLSMPSEMFGQTTSTKIGSLLSWAAWAARFPSDGNGRKLRAIQLAPLPAGGSLVQVLIGDAAPSGDPEFLSTVQVEFGLAGHEQTLPLESVATLGGMAAQGALPIESDQARLVISATRLEPLTLPVPNVPGYVHVIVVAAESDGATEVHRYLFPLEPMSVGHQEFTDAVRTTELFARALAARIPLLAGEAEAALDEPLLDPLTFALLSFRLVYEKRLVQVDTLWRAALARRVQVAPGVPDLHVLAALSMTDADQRAQHMRLASAAGVPLIADAFVAFAAWLEEHAAERGQPPPVAMHTLVRGGAWSLLGVSRGGVQDSRVAVPAATLASSKASWSTRIAPAVSATVKIEAPDAGLIATGFFARPGRLLTMSFVLRLQGQNNVLPSMLPVGWRATGLDSVAMRRVLAITASGPADMSDVSIRVALVETDPVSVPSVSFDDAPPRVGQRVAVIAHNVLESHLARTDREGSAAVFAALKSGEKAIMPGEITALDATGSSFTYDCWTLAGSAGGPVVDLETGAIIGIHYGGTDSSAAKKFGVGVPLSLFALDSTFWSR